jgi:uncharacterized protein (TIGR00255 family)
MILSMTGYGSGSAQKEGLTISVEIRTVNHRFLDLHVRLPREYLFLEGEIQKLVRKVLDRGRVDISATVQNSSSAAFTINTNLVRLYMEAAERLKEEFKFQESLDLKAILNLPGILQNRDSAQVDDAEAMSGLIDTCMKAALEGVARMRSHEGDALQAEMTSILSVIEESAQRIHDLSLNSAAEHMQKLNDRLSQLLPHGGVDPQRLAQEVALLADKCDISEEIARLESHINQFHSLMTGNEKAGKKLDFLLQEMQREANTILSKSGNLDVSSNAISIKAEIEKLREQVQNVE